MTRRVVFTGLGCVTPFGRGVDCLWKAVLESKSCITQLPETEEYSQLPCKIAGTIGEEKWSEGSEGEKRRTSRGVALALTAAQDAISNADLDLSTEKTEDVGVAVGMGMSDLDAIFNTGKLLSEKRYSKLSPYFVPKILTNMAAGRISIEYGLRGPNHSVSTACATGLHSIGDAAELIRRGWADVMICGASDACVTPIGIAGFSRMRALSTSFPDQPYLVGFVTIYMMKPVLLESSRPFDSRRDGFVMSEGAGILVLEELNRALQRKAHCYAEYLGYGLSGDGYHISSPDENGLGAQLCMKRAMQNAGLQPDSIGYVNAHATSTPLGDRAECSAVDRIFDRDIPVSSIKGHLGHCLGAAGAIETIVTILALKNSILPSNLNLESSDIKTKANLLSGKPCELIQRKDNAIMALCNSFGFGGSNASLCIRNFDPNH